MTKKRARSSGSLMNNNWNDDTVKWSEDNIQIAMVQTLYRLEDQYNFTFAAGLEGMKTTMKTASKQKMLGMRAGEADLRLYFDSGFVAFVEVKRGKSGGQRAGEVSQVQKDRHAKLVELGFFVTVLTCDTPAQAQEDITNLIKRLDAMKDSDI